MTTPREPAREAAERELSKPMYHENDPSLFDRALRKFFDWLDDLLGAASGATPGGGFGLFVILVLVVLAVGALWWRLGTPGRITTGAGVLFTDGTRSAADHRTAADAHAAAGRWTEAVQERMRAVVRSLEERTLLDPRPGRTADEAAAEAAVSSPTTPPNSAPPPVPSTTSPTAAAPPTPIRTPACAPSTSPWTARSRC